MKLVIISFQIYGQNLSKLNNIVWLLRPSHTLKVCEGQEALFNHLIIHNSRML